MGRFMSPSTSIASTHRLPRPCPNIEPAVTGWNMDEVTRILRALRGREVIGGDVVCLMPTKDQPNHITAMVAGAIMYELVGLIADTAGRWVPKKPARI